MIIRNASANDIPFLLALTHQLGYTIAADNFEKNFYDLITREDCLLKVVEKEGEVVGYATLHFLHWLHSDMPTARLSALVIDEKVRNEGIGAILLHELESIARLNGCAMIEVTSSVHRKQEGTHRFYERLGYGNMQGKSTYFRKSLNK